VHSPQFIVDSPLQQKTYITWDTTITVSAVDDLISFGDGVGVGVGETVVNCDTLYRKEFINMKPAVGEAFESVFNLYTFPEGVYTISYYSVDTVGNTETGKAYTVIIDTTPPTTAVEVSTPMYKAIDRIFVTERTKFVLTSMDGGVVPSGVKKIEYSVDDGEFREYIEPFDLFGIGEGEHVVHYRAIDNLGNTEKIKSLTVVVDNTPPYTIAEVSAPKYHAPDDGLYVSYRAKFTLTATDGGAIPSGVKETLYSIDAGLFTVYSEEFGLVNLDDGIHDVKYFSEDNVGNKEKVNTLSVKLDNTAPISKLTIDGPQYTANGKTYISTDSKIILTVNDPVKNNVASGVREFKYTINGTTDYYSFTTEFNVYETSVVFKLCGGVHTVKCYGIDNVNNIEPENSFTLYVDTVPPTTEISVSEPKAVGFGKVIISPSTEITLTSYDLLIDSVASGVNRTLYRINYATWTTNWVVYVASFTLQESEEAVIEYYSIDNVGNAEIVNYATFTVTVLGEYASVGSATTTVKLNGNATVVGSIRSNGDIYLSGNSKITGDAISSCDVVLRGKSSVAGQIVSNASPILSEPINLTSIEDVVRTQNDNNRISSLLSKDGELKLTGKDKVVIPAGTYYITRLSVSGSAEISVSGKVNIFVADEIEISGDAKVNIGTATSVDDLIIFCSNNSKKENKISGNSIVKAIIYSPYSTIKLSGNSYFFGHLFANSITLDGNVVLEQPQYNKPLAMSAPRLSSPVSAAVAMAGENNSDNDDTAEFKLRDSYVAPNLAIISGNKVYAASRNYSADAQTPAPERCCIKLVLKCGIADKVRAKVYTLTGELVWEAELDGRTQWTTVGNNYAYVIQWSPEDNNNSKSLLPSGVYFCLLEAEKAGYPTLRKINKLIIVR
jgi:cytoskeletal protein CcmA (bactofilin family)